VSYELESDLETLQDWRRGDLESTILRSPDRWLTGGRASREIRREQHLRRLGSATPLR